MYMTSDDDWLISVHIHTAKSEATWELHWGH